MSKTEQRSPQKKPKPTGKIDSQPPTTSLAPLDNLLLQRAIAAPGGLPPADIVRLQRTIGNRAVQRLLDRNEPEQEAEQMATAVTGVSVSDLQLQVDETTADEAVESQLAAAPGGGRPLPEDLRPRLESRFGADLSPVRIHTDDRAEQMNRQLDSRAFTYGPAIYFDRGQYNPTAPEGQHILAHELTHTAQQGAVVTPAITQRTSKQIQPFGRYWRLIRRYGRKALSWVGKWGWRVVGWLTRWGMSVIRWINRWGLQVIDWLRRWGTRVIGWVNRWGVRIIGWLKKYGPRVVNWLKRAGNQILEGMKTYGPKVLEWVSQLPNKIIAALIKYGTQIFKWIAANPEESLLLALEVAIEIAAAVASGGTSIVARVAKWLVTTGMKLKNVVGGVVGKIKTFTSLDSLSRIIPVGRLFSVVGLTHNMMLALFGRLPAQQAEPAEQATPKKPPAKKAGVGGKLFRKVAAVINFFKKIYYKLRAAIAGLLGRLDLTKYDWFQKLAVVYYKVKRAISAVAGKIGGWLGSMKDKIMGFLGGVVDKVKGVLAFFANPTRQIAQWVKGIVSSGVTFLLNLLITNPPSAVLKVLFKIVRAVVATMAGKSLIDLVIEKVPFAKAIIGKISETVMALIGGYITEPAKAIYEKGQELFETKAMPVVTAIQDQIAGLMADARTFMDQLTGGKFSQLAAEKAEEGPPVQAKFNAAPILAYQLGSLGQESPATVLKSGTGPIQLAKADKVKETVKEDIDEGFTDVAVAGQIAEWEKTLKEGGSLPGGVKAYLKRRKGDPAKLAKLSPTEIKAHRRYMKLMDRVKVVLHGGLSGLKAKKRKQKIHRNFARADYQLSGPATKQAVGNLSAISGDPDPIEARVKPDQFALTPTDRFFKTFAIGGRPADADSEVKLCERLAHRVASDALGKTTAKGQIYQNLSGTITIFSERPVCASCAGVISQFHTMFPNVKVIVLDGEGGRKVLGGHLPDRGMPAPGIKL